MPLKQKAENIATTNSYASILKCNIWDMPNVSVIIKNSQATNVADYKILVANGNGTSSDTWAEEKAEAQLAGNNATVKYVLGNSTPLPYGFVDIQAKSNSAGNAATLTVYLYAARR